VVLAGVTTLLLVPRCAKAAHALVDLLDGATLEQAAPSTEVAPDQAMPLLLVQVVRERIIAGALAYSTEVPVVAVGGDPGVSLAAHARLPVGELLQLVLLARSRSAIATLAAAVGPGWDRTRARMRRAATRLGLRATTVPDEWPAEASPAVTRRVARPRTTIGDLARLAGAVAGDAEIRRRLALDGAPIANGALIVRATDPLIALAAAAPHAASPSAHTAALASDAPAAIAIGERDRLVLLAVAIGADSSHAATQVLDDAVTRYRRVDLVRAGQPIGGNVADRDGVVTYVAAVAARPFSITVPRAGAFAIDAWLQLRARPDVPLRPTQRIGELVFQAGGRIVGAVPLVAGSPPGPGGWIDTASR
jgi:hypothetical protein